MSEKGDPQRFQAAMEELEAILEQVEGEEIDIDDLGRQLERAADLLRICRKKLRRADLEIREIMEQLEDDPMAADGQPDDLED